jgi:hypothetical protein
VSLRFVWFCVFLFALLSIFFTFLASSIFIRLASGCLDARGCCYACCTYELHITPNCGAPARSKPLPPACALTMAYSHQVCMHV